MMEVYETNVAGPFLLTKVVVSIFFCFFFLGHVMTSAGGSESEWTTHVIVFSEVIEGELNRDERSQHGTLRNSKPSGPSSSVLQPSGFSEMFLRVQSSNTFQILGYHSGFP